MHLITLWLFACLAADSAAVTHYDLAVRPDFATQRLSVRSRITLTGTAHSSSYSFGLNGAFDSVSVSVDGAPADFTREPRGLEVRFQTGRARHSVDIVVSGRLGQSDDEARSVIGQDDLFLLWSDLWYPAALTDYATTRLRITLPARFQVMAPGTETSRTTAGGRITHVFESRTPVGIFSVFADARWLRSDSVVKGVPITLLLHPQSAAFRDTLFKSSSDVVRFFTDLHGYYPFERFAFITQDSMFARRAYNGFIGYEPAWLAREMTRTGYDAHETSLLWWGGATRGRGPGAWQWTEGFGDYVEVLYSQARGLPLPGNFARFREQYLAMPDSQDVPLSALRGSTPQKIVHGKYPWLMHVLRYRVGDDAFRRGIRLLFARYRYRTYTLDQFVQAFADAAGSALDWWRTEWLERTGVPHWTLQYEVSATHLSGSIEQLGNVYHLPVELGVYSRNNLVIERVDLNAATTRFSYDLAAAPDSVRLDPHHWLLAHITGR